MNTSLFGVLLFLGAFIAFPSHAAHPGVYVCATDNCARQFREHGEALFEACRAGVADAAKSSPDSAACRAMCSNAYPGAESDEHDACKTGCALYPSHCLRDGKFPPKDDYLRDKIRP